ncbi:RAP domain-containing protein [Endozoicomonas sp. ALB115]|uniref:RAP domain-containing protein n=2 Tax=unclassified Endozoicomonas TaxID=2644528 RepID=UPI003BB634FE
MDRSSAGISGKYTRSVNNYNQPNNHASSSGRGRYRHATVRPWDISPRTAPGRNEFYHSSGTRSFQHLQCRSVNPAQDFNALIKQEIMDDLLSKSDYFGHRYDGRHHGQYASLIKKYTSAAERPLNRAEQSQLIRLLQNFTAKRSWNWRSLTTTLHSFTSAGVFAFHKPMDERVKLTQAHLLSTLIDAIIFNCSQKTEARNIDARGIANLLWAMAKLVDNGLERTSEFNEAVAALLPHVNAQKDQFKAQGIANLLWAMAKLVDNGQEQTPGLNEAVAALLPFVNAQKNQLNAQAIANLLWAMAKLVDNGLERAPGLNEAVAALLPIVNAQKNQLNAQAIVNLLWAMAKLVDNGLERTRGLNEAVAALLPLVNAQKDQFIPQHIANLLWAMAKLVDHGQTQTQGLNEAVVALLPLVNAQKNQLNAQAIANLLWAITKLVDNRQEWTPEFKAAVAALLPLVNAQKNQLNAQGIANLLWAMAKLVDNGLERTQGFNEAVAALLPHMNAQKNQLNAQAIANLLWAMAKLVDNEQKQTPGLNEAVAALLPLVNAQKDQFIPQHIANLLWAMAKLVDHGQEQTQAFNEAVAALLPLVNAQKNQLNAQAIAKLLWAMAKLVDNGHEWTPAFNKTVAALFHRVNVQKDQFKARAIPNLLWAMAKLVDHGLEWTPGLNEAVAVLLPLVNAQKNQLNAQAIANLLWAMAKLVDNGQEQTPEFKEAVAALLPLVNAQKDQFIPQHIANLLWAMAKLGELVELNVVASTFESLVYRISENPQFPQQDISMSLWGVMVCCARLVLDSNANKNNVFENHMDDLLTRLENTSPDNEDDQSIMIMAASWLGRASPVVRHYQTAISKTQAQFRDRLQSSIPSLKIEEEKSLNSLPPVDLLLPDHNVVIEVQGPSHYVGGDFKTRNGSTLLKIALLQKAGFEVIEIPVTQLGSPDSIKRCIDQIKIRVDILAQQHGSVSLTQTRGAGERYVTADKGWQDHCDLTNEGHSVKQTGKPKSRKKKRK